jgi:hypothetical protein
LVSARSRDVAQRHDEVTVSVVAPDGTVADGPENKAYVVGATIVDVPSRDEAIRWAQEVREFLPDPAVGN